MALEITWENQPTFFHLIPPKQPTLYQLYYHYYQSPPYIDYIIIIKILMIMALEITWENQPTLFLGLGADDRCHIRGRRNVLCKVKTKGNNKDINREEIIQHENISNFSR